MTEATVDLFHPRMDPVAEIYWLLRTQVAVGVRIIKIEHNHKKNTHHPNPEEPSSRFYFCVF
jgi:hypothetical protein